MMCGWIKIIRYNCRTLIIDGGVSFFFLEKTILKERGMKQTMICPKVNVGLERLMRWIGPIDGHRSAVTIKEIERLNCSKEKVNNEAD